MTTEDGAQVRPQVGQLVRRDGTSVPVAFLPTVTNGLVFLVVDRNGEAVHLERGDAVHVDDLGAASPVVVEHANTWSRS